MPAYLHSAVKGRSYLSNARAHVGDGKLLKIDIAKFYQSVPQHKVMHFFRDVLACAPDVASLLANLICYRGVLATGSSISPIISYYAYKAMFDGLAGLAAHHGLVMTCYVDDITMSGPGASRAVLHEARSAIFKAGRCQRALDAAWPKVMELRRRYFVECTDTAKAEMEAAIEVAQAARADLDAALAAMLEESGIDPDELTEKAEPVGDPFPRISRASIIDGAPPVSDLPEAIELIERHAPPGWLAREPADLFRFSGVKDGKPISIVKGVRLEGERPSGHRLRQTITLAKDYLAHDPRYDHFAGALAVTQLAQLGLQFEALRSVKGYQDRIDALFSGAETDAIILELLVAAACARKGRDMAVPPAIQPRLQPDRESFLPPQSHAPQG